MKLDKLENLNKEINDNIIDDNIIDDSSLNQEKDDLNNENLKYSKEKLIIGFFEKELTQICVFRIRSFWLLFNLLILWNLFIFAIIITQGILSLHNIIFLSDKVLIAVIAAASISNLMGIALKFIFSSKSITGQFLRSDEDKKS